MSIALGLIGAGGIAQFHAQIATKVGLKLVAVCDIDEKRQTRISLPNQVDNTFFTSDFSAIGSIDIALY